MQRRSSQSSVSNPYRKILIRPCQQRAGENISVSNPYRKILIFIIRSPVLIFLFRFQSLQEDSNPTKKRVSTHFLDLSQSKNCIRQNNHKISIYLYRCYYSHISQCMSNYAIFCAIGHRQRSPIYHPAQYNRNLSYSLLPNHSLKLPEATLLVH